MKKLLGLLVPLALAASTASAYSDDDWTEMSETSARYQTFTQTGYEAATVLPNFFTSGTGNSLPIVAEPADVEHVEIKITVRGESQEEADAYLADIKHVWSNQGFRYQIPSKDYACDHKETHSHFSGYQRSGVTEGGWNWSVKSGVTTGEDKSYMLGVCLTEIRIYYPRVASGALVINNGELTLMRENSTTTLEIDQQISLYAKWPGTDAEKMKDLKVWTTSHKSYGTIGLEPFTELVNSMKTDDTKLAVVGLLAKYVNAADNVLAQLGTQLFPKDEARAQKAQTFFKK